MAQGKTIDVDRLVDDQRITSFNWMLVISCFVITLIDGYDISAAPAAGPFFVREWHLASPAELTWAFSATNFGVLFGAPLFGWVGDRFGRKVAIILSLVSFGLFTLVVAFATSTSDLTWARFLTGFGIGGVVANTIALNAEMAPRRVRATFIILMFVGTTFGGIFPPIVANTLAGTYGWQLIFWIGGILPLVIAAFCWFLLPESIKFLSLMPSRRDKAIRVAQRIEPGLVIGPADRFVSSSDTASKPRLADLFAGKFALVTPLLWLLFAVNLMVFYFVNVWLQTIITPALLKAGGSAATAQNANLMFQLGGSICAVLMCRFVDKKWGCGRSFCSSCLAFRRPRQSAIWRPRPLSSRLRSRPAFACSAFSSGSMQQPEFSTPPTCARSASAMRLGSAALEHSAARWSAVC